MIAARAKRAFIAVNLGIAMFLLVVGHSFMTAMTRSVTLGIEALGSDTVMVGDRENGFVNSPTGTGLDEDDLAIMRQALGARFAVAGAARSFAPVAIAGREEPTTVFYVDEDFFEVTRVERRSGRDFTAREHARGEPVCMISERFAETGQGDPRQVAVEDIPCRVIGMVSSDEVIPGQSLERAIYRPLESLIEPASRGRGALSTVYLRAATGTPTREDIERIRELIPPQAEGRGDMLWVGEQFWKAREQITNSLSLLVTSLSLVLVSMAAAGLANALSLEVMARRMEIGLRLAIGATPRDILWLIGRDGAKIALAGGLIGIGAGVMAIHAVLNPMLAGSSVLPNAALETGASTIVLAGAVLLVAAALAIAIPAIRAMRIDPALTLRNL